MISETIHSLLNILLQTINITIKKNKSYERYKWFFWEKWA